MPLEEALRRAGYWAAMSQENVETVAAIYTGWERGDFTVGVPLFERNVTLVVDEGVPGGGVYVGREGVRSYMRPLLDAWDLFTITAESFKDLGDTVLVKVRQTGTGRGSGVTVDQRYFQLWTFRGAKVVRLDTILSETEALAAAGVRE